MQRIPRVPLVLAALLTAGTARAQTSDPAAAEALFRDAKGLVAAGRLAEACPKFLASYKLDPKTGAMMNLADCYEKNGQFASAWARYLEGASLAQRAGQPEREQYARDHAKALEPRLSRLSIATAPTPGLEVRRDGELLDPAMVGTALPVDAGKHVIEARAAGKKAWTTTVDVPVGGAPVKVDVPLLDDAAAGGPAQTPVGPVQPVQPGGPVGAPAPGEAQPAPFWGTQRKVGVAAGVVGLVGVGVGAAFGATAMSKWSSAKNDHCSGTPLTCDATGVSLTSDARSAATISSATFIPGAVLLAAGVVLFATAPKGKAPPATGLVLAPAPVPGGASFTLTGRL